MSEPKDEIRAMIPENAAAFEAGLKAAGHEEVLDGHFLHHKDFQITNRLKEQLEANKMFSAGPVHPKGVLELTRPESFATAFDRYRDDRTAVFANPEDRMIRAVFDYYESQSGKLGWGQFEAVMRFHPSRKLKEWEAVTDWSGQQEFAEFIEDHLEDVVEPSGQELLSIATDLEASSSGSFKGRVNLDNGSVALHYQDETQTTVEVPRHLTLGIPLFEHGDRYRLQARLRFRVAGGGVRFRVLFTNLGDAQEQEFERIVQELEAKIETPILRGQTYGLW